jgi:chemotaxis protein CheX
MSLRDFILESINQCTTQVFSTMLGVELNPGQVIEKDGSRDVQCEVVSLIGIAGALAGAGSVSCSANMACKICALMLMTEAENVNEDVLDAVAELTNMIVGNVKTELESRVGPLGLGIPTVVYGRNFQTKTSGDPGWIITRFHLDGEALTIKICLAPNHRDGNTAVEKGTPEAVLV